jgi:hypothetical protein
MSNDSQQLCACCNVKNGIPHHFSGAPFCDTCQELKGGECCAAYIDEYTADCVSIDQHTDEAADNLEKMIMSYDIWLSIDTGGDEPAYIIGVDWNYTSNCAFMWREAGVDLAEFDKRLASTCIADLTSAIQYLKKYPEKFIHRNPANKWGSYKTLIPALEQLLANLVKHPKAIVNVSR